MKLKLYHILARVVFLLCILTTLTYVGLVVSEYVQHGFLDIAVLCVTVPIFTLITISTGVTSNRMKKNYRAYELEQLLNHK